MAARFSREVVSGQPPLRGRPRFRGFEEYAVQSLAFALALAIEFGRGPSNGVRFRQRHPAHSLGDTHDLFLIDAYTHRLA